MLKSNETFILNAGMGIESDVYEVFKFVQKFAGSDSEAVHGPAAPGEQTRSFIDSSMAKQKLDWEATKGLKDGIRKPLNSSRLNNSNLCYRKMIYFRCSSNLIPLEIINVLKIIRWPLNNLLLHFLPLTLP